MMRYVLVPPEGGMGVLTSLQVRDLKGENLKKYWKFEELRPLMFH